MNGYIENLIDFVGEDEMEYSLSFENSWISDFYNDEANYDWTKSTIFSIQKTILRGFRK